MIPDTDLPDYYARRAGEYEKIYTKPERQADLASLRTWLREQLTGHAVLEVACGTGYWTQAICASAESIVATDINGQVLDIARHKTYTRDKVEFRIADAYTPGGLSGDFTAGIFDRCLRALSERVHRLRVSHLLAEIRQHRLDDFGRHRGSCAVVEVNSHTKSDESPNRPRMTLI